MNEKKWKGTGRIVSRTWWPAVHVENHACRLIKSPEIIKQKAMIFIKLFQFNLHLYRIVDRALRTMRSTLVLFFCLDCLVSVFRLLPHCVRLCIHTHLIKANNTSVFVTLPTCPYSFFLSLPFLILRMYMFMVVEPTHETITSAWNKKGTSDSLVWC
jgi:hypothetical protein